MATVVRSKRISRIWPCEPVAEVMFGNAIDRSYLRSVQGRRVPLLAPVPLTFAVDNTTFSTIPNDTRSPNLLRGRLARPPFTHRIRTKVVEFAHCHRLMSKITPARSRIPAIYLRCSVSRTHSDWPAGTKAGHTMTVARSAVWGVISRRDRSSTIPPHASAASAS